MTELFHLLDQISWNQ